MSDTTVQLRYISMQRETANAWLIDFGPTPTSANHIIHWMPKSQCQIDYLACTITCPYWLIIAKSIPPSFFVASTHTTSASPPPPPPPPPAAPNPPPAGDRPPSLALLIKLLGMTQSENDAEALVALRKATAEMRKFPGGTWADLLSGKVTVIGDPFANLATPRSGSPSPRPSPRPSPSPPPPPPPTPPPPHAKKRRSRTNPFNLNDALSW